ncbi:MAG: hypothetical protein NZ534_06835, partial [Bacteroidia bacterium]|nr:hypothetical protein [Bacteroidia bacterium]
MGILHVQFQFMPDRTRRPAVMPIQSRPFPPVETVRLSNGMPVYFSVFGAAPVVELSFVVPGGHCREPR